MNATLIIFSNRQLELGGKIIRIDREKIYHAWLNSCLVEFYMPRWGEACVVVTCDWMRLLYSSYKKYVNTIGINWWMFFLHSMSFSGINLFIYTSKVSNGYAIISKNEFIDDINIFLFFYSKERSCFIINHWQNMKERMFIIRTNLFHQVINQQEWSLFQSFPSSINIFFMTVGHWISILGKMPIL